MKTVVVREIDVATYEDAEFVLDLREKEIKNCTGCWCCWQKTPGRCAAHDLDDFHRAYLQADRVVFYIGVSCDFVSGRVKTLFDRMIPHFLPYTGYKTGESLHEPRYERYPDVEVHYQGEFSDGEAQSLYEDYLARVFYQFHVKNTTVTPIGAVKEAI